MAAAPNFSDATKPGRVDTKYLVYFGLGTADGSKLSATPQGTYLITGASGTTNRGANSLAIQGYDISHQFTMSVNADLPHVLYGNQTDIRYDANYNLTNPSGDLKTWVCDAKKFMTAQSDNAQFSSSYKFLFNALTNGVNVFVGSPGTPASSAVSGSTYTWYADTGTVVFNSNQAANAVISLDGVPTAMAPEMMIKHLFVDYGGWDPNYLNLQTSNTLIPTYTGGRGASVWQIATDIAKLTAPRLVPWQIRATEGGTIAFYENRFSSTSVETLVDDRDLFNIQYNITDNVQNVWRATATANNGQQLISIASDVPSIRDNGQRATADIESNLLYPIGGMNPGPGISLMNGATAARLTQTSQLTTEITCDLVPNFLRQAGDRVTIIEQSNGLSGPYILKGLTNKIGQGGFPTQSARLQKAVIGINYNMGIPSAVSSAALSVGSTPPAVNGTTNIIQTLSINGTAVIANGATLKDGYGNPILPVLAVNQSWRFSLIPYATQNYDSVFFHYIYLECPNTISSSDLMAIRGTGFNDGTVVNASTIAAGTTITATHATGTTVNNGTTERGYAYSGLVLMATQSYLPSGYSALYTSITNNAAASAYLGAATTYGVGYGPSYTSGAWWPQSKQTYGYFVVQASNANGATTIARVPFILSL